ncbi:hypothetical protein BCD67_02565 [Oscillatoriales cyanobacterium USR001]|nr:hypothetical protein BCD67_02565 [Oscillatoriales cyanobacterium USR001]
MDQKLNNNEELNPKSTECSPETPNKMSKIEARFLELNTSFEQAALIQNPVNQEYEIIKEAKRLHIPVESYRRMLESYCKSLDNSVKAKSLLKPVSWLDHRFGDFVEWLAHISIVKFSILIGEATLLAAMMSYVTDAPKREQEGINDARQTIIDRQDQIYTQARIDALKFLNNGCASIIGIQAPKASMPKIELNNCYKFQLNAQTFAQWPPQFYRYQGMDMSRGNLQGADLEGANLKGANLMGINLAGANLEESNLEGANLEGANLEGANLRRSNLKGANLTRANLDKVRLSRSNLNGANLQEAKITNARLLWANLSGANLAFSNLEGSNLSRAKLNNVDFYNANLKKANLNNAELLKNTMLINANLEEANLIEAKFWSVDQVKRGKGWEKAQKENNWEKMIANPVIDKPKIGLVKYRGWTIFEDYQKGIEKVGGTEIITVDSGFGIENEANAIEKLIASDVDVILFRPQDPIKSAPAITKAYNLGVIPIALGDCLNTKDSERDVFACYESDSVQMGYDSALYLIKSASKLLTGKAINIGLVDGANSQGVYPYFKGFMNGLTSSNISWKIIALTDAEYGSDKAKVKKMLQSHPEINVIWGGSDTTTDLAIQAVEELGLSDKVLIYGILKLNRDYAKMLLNPQHPLQLLVDENPQKVAEEATKMGISILNGEVTGYGYKYRIFPHRLLSQEDDVLVQQLLMNNLSP